MNVIAMIPARYNAARFPGKLMKNLGGKPVVLRTYEAVLHTDLFDEVYIVTDSDIIFETIVTCGNHSNYIHIFFFKTLLFLFVSFYLKYNLFS